jgi:hypothetical protein
MKSARARLANRSPVADAIGAGRPILRPHQSARGHNGGAAAAASDAPVFLAIIAADLPPSPLAGAPVLTPPPGLAAQQSP